MDNNYLLSSETAKKLYKAVGSLPVYDYHCHLSPEEICIDAPFENIGKLWLEHDHYKWRLMRAYGINEEKITGNADWQEKFYAFAESIELAAGSPLYHWVQMELSIYFGIDIPLSRRTAEQIWVTANTVISQKRLSPRKLIELSNVRYIATTDDIADSLVHHSALLEEGYSVTVAPTFRTDKLLLINNERYFEYIRQLSIAACVDITNLSSLKEAVSYRLDFFKEQGCRFADVGIPFFPDYIGSDMEAEIVFNAALNGKSIKENEYLAFLGHMYLFLGNLFYENDIVMQWHLAVERNANRNLFIQKGADSGGDCMGDIIPIRNITGMLDAINDNGGLPKTILYTLNPAMLEPLSSAAGCFRNVSIGAAWWFNDHKGGIEQTIETVAHSLHIGRFFGMLTDSRSFLSFARHDYFRRILCSMIGKWVESGEFGGNAEQLCKDICCGNIERLLGNNSEV